MPFGYMTMMLIAFVPPLWHKLMRERLEHWDRKFASAGEQELVRASQGTA
jgi:alkane 1-monooxygenase